MPGDAGGQQGLPRVWGSCRRFPFHLPDIRSHHGFSAVIGEAFPAHDQIQTIFKKILKREKREEKEEIQARNEITTCSDILVGLWDGLQPCCPLPFISNWGGSSGMKSLFIGTNSPIRHPLLLMDLCLEREQALTDGGCSLLQLLQTFCPTDPLEGLSMDGEIVGNCKRRSSWNPKG